MKMKPKSTVHNKRALLYRRFIGLESSNNLSKVFLTQIDGKYWLFDAEELKFTEIAQNLVPTTSSVVTITDNSYILQYQSHYFNYYNYNWVEISNLPNSFTLLSASFNNIAKYQMNKYYYVGSFDYMVTGSIEGSTTQYIKGNITPLQSMDIKHYNDSINLGVDDLVVIGDSLYAVENPQTTLKQQPKPFKVHFATLNSIL